jgi:hypothetical protein
VHWLKSSLVPICIGEVHVSSSVARKLLDLWPQCCSRPKASNSLSRFFWTIALARSVRKGGDCLPKTIIAPDDCTWIIKNTAVAIGEGGGFRLVKDLAHNKRYPSLSTTYQSSGPTKGYSNPVKVQRHITDELESRKKPLLGTHIQGPIVGQVQGLTEDALRGSNATYAPG